MRLVAGHSDEEHPCVRLRVPHPEPASRGGAIRVQTHHQLLENLHPLRRCRTDRIERAQHPLKERHAGSIGIELQRPREAVDRTGDASVQQRGEHPPLREPLIESDGPVDMTDPDGDQRRGRAGVAIPAEHAPDGTGELLAGS